MRVDFFATHPHYVDHAVPVWFALPEKNRGDFYVPSCTKKHLESFGIKSATRLSDNTRPLVFMSYGEIPRMPPMRRFVFLAHGAEQTYNNAPPMIRMPQLKLALTNPTSEDAMRRVNPHAKVISLGCPKLDKYHGREFPRHEKPVIAFSHHWDQKMLPETGSAWPWSKEVIESIVASGKYEVLGHKHPADKRPIEKWWASLGVEFVPLFSDILERADLYVADNTSTLYEFAATNRPVVCLSPPTYRRNKDHGLRFWESVPGVECAIANHLPACIEEALADVSARQELRKKAVNAAYGTLDGNAAERAADVILSAFK